MKSKDLKKIQAPIKEKYKKDPSTAKVTLMSSGKIADGITCKIGTGKLLLEAGLHPSTGGDGTSLCSGDMLLESLVACAGVTLNAVATSLGISIKDGTVKAEGDLDFRGTLGVDKNVPVGFSEIRLKFEIDSDATPEQRDSLFKLTERYCVIYQTLAKPPVLKVSR